MNDIPRGLCQCGCGGHTRIAAHNNARLGQVKGQPLRFIHHHSCGRPMVEHDGERFVPRLCACGCGNYAPLSSGGWPQTYIFGHHTRKRRNFSRYTVEDRGYETPCWIWQGKLGTSGYTKMKVNGRTMTGHRAFYERYVGPVPDGHGHHLHHLCGEKACVNPDHLHLITAAEHNAMHPGVKLSKEDAEFIRTCSLSPDELAERFAVHPVHIRNIRHGRRRPGDPGPITPSARSGPAKLSDDEVRTILAALKDGRTQSSLAREFDVSSGTISNIVAGKTYRDISRE